MCSHARSHTWSRSPSNAGTCTPTMDVHRRTCPWPPSCSHSWEVNDPPGPYSWEMNDSPGPSCCTWAPEGNIPRGCLSHSLLVFQADDSGNALFLVSCHNSPFAHQLPGLRARVRVPPPWLAPAPSSADTLQLSLGLREACGERVLNRKPLAHCQPIPRTVEGLSSKPA